MTVYHYNTSLNHFMIVFLSAIIAVLIGVGVRVVIMPIFRGDKDDHGNRIDYKDIPLTSKLIFQGGPAPIILVGCIGLGNLIRGYAGFEINMMSGNAQTWSGDPELVSYEESWYRDSFLGYEVTLSLDGLEFKPADDFTMEMIELFESDTELTICYGYTNDELFVWTITKQTSISE